MKALVKYGLAAGAIELRDEPSPAPRADEVLLRVAACAVCGSDLAMYRGTFDHPMKIPVVMGHEFAGTIEQVGHGVEDWTPGDRVACETAAHICGKCAYCRSGDYNMCPERKGFGYGCDGAFAEYVVAPARLLHRLPDSLPFVHAALTEPAAGALHGLRLNTRLAAGTSALVLGPGPIGLFALQHLRNAGVNPIFVAGVGCDHDRLELARELGAHRTIVVGSEDPRKIIREGGDGLGVHCVVEASGAPQSLDLALDVVRPLGTIVRIGMSDKPLPFGLNRLTAKAVNLQGTWSHTYEDWEGVLHMVQTGQLRISPMVSKVYPLGQWHDAFEDALAGRVVKAVIEPSGSV
jgi:L-iditol 2-dehydrogenase